MKVAIVGRYPPAPSHIRGGVEAVTLRLSEGLARHHDVDVHVVVAELGRELGTTRGPDGVTREAGCGGASDRDAEQETRQHRGEPLDVAA